MKNALILILALFFAVPASAQFEAGGPGQPYPYIGPSYNATSGTPYSVLGSPVINLLSNQTSPIISPEGAQPANPLAIYFGAPHVVGWASTITAASGTTYQSSATNNITITGSNSGHYGMEERSMTTTAASPFTLSGEINQYKSYLLNRTNVTLNNYGGIEAGVDNQGTIAGWRGFYTAIANGSTGTMTRATSYDDNPSNSNATGGSFFLAVGYHCSATIGTISARFCMWNEEPKADIANLGHYISQSTNGNIPTSGCGTITNISNVKGTDQAFELTSNTGAGCSITFARNYGVVASILIIPSDGGTSPTYTYNAGGITFSAIRNAGIYQAWVMGGK